MVFVSYNMLLFHSTYAWWICIFVILILIGLIIYLIKKNKKLKLQSEITFQEQQLFIRNERQRISGEIHDDIGSGLFAIQLFADLASKNRTDVLEIKQISEMVNEMSEKINEIIWSTNTDSDFLENLLYYIEHQTIKLFEHTDIEFEPDFPIDVPVMIVNSQSRRNTFLLVKEIVYNAIKHAKASKVSLSVQISNVFLIFTVKDNGVGFDPNDIRQNAMGLKNIKSRLEKLNGSFTVENYNGTKFLVKIPIAKGFISSLSTNY